MPHAHAYALLITIISQYTDKQVNFIISHLFSLNITLLFRWDEVLVNAYIEEVIWRCISAPILHFNYLLNSLILLSFQCSGSLSSQHICFFWKLLHYHCGVCSLMLILHRSSGVFSPNNNIFFSKNKSLVCLDIQEMNIIFFTFLFNFLAF